MPTDRQDRPPEGTETDNPESKPTGWAVLREALNRRPSRGQWIVALLLFGLGFGLAIQVRTTQQDALSAARTSDLVRILDDLSSQRERLASEEAQLQATLAELETTADQAQVARAASKQRLQNLRILAGVVPVTGPGITMTIADPDGVLKAGDILDAIQELRDAGAEAISVDGERVVATTAIVDTTEGIAVGKTVLTSPIEIRAIGDPDTLSAGLSFPGGVIESVREAGAEGIVVERDVVDIAARS
ncbi:MAG: DUF881 domain-containing protein [Actinobacteria bacterium]|nr:DUF881 domain-containing protein [Actinomycetota bacterium]